MAYTQDELGSGLDAKATPVDADLVVVVDTEDNNRAKKSTWTQLKAFLKTYFDTLYQAILAEGAFADGDKTKLDGIETSADVTDETNVKSSLDGATITGATVATGDKVLIQDVDDSDNLKQVTAQSIADLGGGGAKQTITFGGSASTLGHVFRPNGQCDTATAAALGTLRYGHPVTETGTINTIAYVHQSDLSSNNATLKVWVNITDTKDLVCSAGAEGVDTFTSQNISVTAGDVIQIEYDSGATTPLEGVINLTVE